METNNTGTDDVAIDVTIEIISEITQYPEGTTAGNWKIYLENESGDINYLYIGPNKFITFMNVFKGTYTAYAARINDADEIIGNILSDTVIVQDPLAIAVNNKFKIS